MSEARDYLPTPLSTLKRGAARGRYDRATVHAILDEGVYCLVACQAGERPTCTPMVYARRGEEILLHGSVANRTLRALRDGAAACLNVSLLDGLVLARSAFRTSVNYRSVTVHGHAREIEGEEKREALAAIIEAVAAGRWRDVRPPDVREMAMTLVVAVPLAEVSAKVRSGPPTDLEDDLALACWAGVIPLAPAFGAPVDAPGLAPDTPAPDYVRHYRRGAAHP
ncbi:MAG: pyridoxamine 5'-phosphate oxidase family protein [Myxococcota bacterium]